MGQHLEDKKRLNKEKQDLEKKMVKQNAKITRLEFENNQLKERVEFLVKQLDELNNVDRADVGNSAVSDYKMNIFFPLFAAAAVLLPKFYLFITGVKLHAQLSKVHKIKKKKII